MRSPDNPLPTDMGSPGPGVEQRLRLRALRMSWIKDLVQAVAFTAAGIWAIYNFWYREKYLPRTIDSNVVVKTTLEKLGEKDGLVAVRLGMLAENHGAAPARILGLNRYLYGRRVSSSPPGDGVRPTPGGPLPAVGAYVETDQTSQSTGELLYNTVEIDEPFDGNSDTTIRPAGYVTEEHILYVRRADYAFLSGEVSVAWLPAAFPAVKDCYTLERRKAGGVRIVVNQKGPPGVCRLSTSSGDASLSLW